MANKPWCLFGLVEYANTQSYHTAYTYTYKNTGSIKKLSQNDFFLSLYHSFSNLKYQTQNNCTAGSLNLEHHLVRPVTLAKGKLGIQVSFKVLYGIDGRHESCIDGLLHGLEVGRDFNWLDLTCAKEFSFVIT